MLRLRNEVAGIYLMAYFQGRLETVVGTEEGSIAFDHSCVGKLVHFTLRGVPLLLILPKFTRAQGSKGFRVAYTGMNIELDWLSHLRGDNDVTLGIPNRVQNGAVTGFSASAFIIKSTDDLKQRRAAALLPHLRPWIVQFVRWLEILSWTDSQQDRTKVIDGQLPYAFLVGSAEHQRVTHKSGGSISVIASMPSYLPLSLVELAAHNAGEQKEVPANYSLLHTGLKQFNQEYYREGLLNAATAFELSLALSLDAELTRSPVSHRKLITGKYRGIRDLYGALNGCGAQLPPWDDVRLKISEPRNQAIHKGTEITVELARSSLEFTRNFLLQYHPLT